jgi:hypothetical protein
MQKHLKICFWISTILLLIYFTLLLLFGSTTFADALRGYETLFQYNELGIWNNLSYPADIGSDFHYFVSWWSPGQWLLPYLIIKITGIASFQTIQTIIIIPSLLICVFGYTLLFKKLGFSSLTRWIAMLCIVSNQLFYWQTLMYYGGDLLLLALFPFFILLIIEEKKKTIWWYFSFSTVLILGLLAKNTFVILIICALIFMLSRKGIKQTKLKFHIIVSAISTMLIVLFYFLHLKWGETPGSATDTEGYNGIPNDWLGDLFYSIGSPFGIFSRITFFIQKIAGHIGFINAFQLIPALISILFVIYLTKKPVSTYQQLIIRFALPFIGFFCLMFILNQAVSYEMRHFAPVAFLFFPGIIDWMLGLKWKKIMLFAIYFFCLTDLAWFAYSFKRIESESTFWNTLKVSKSDAENLETITKWDNKNSQSLVLIEDYWALNIAARKNKKLVVQKDNLGWKVITGMELDRADYCNLNTTAKLNGYDKILIISSKKTKNQLANAFRGKKSILIKSTDEFNFYEVKLDEASPKPPLPESKQL